MASPKLRAVTDDGVNLGEDFVEEARKEAQKTPTVRELVSVSARTLKKWIEQMKQEESAREALKASATAEYDRTVADAKQLMDEIHAKADADLKELRETMKHLEPARAALSEKAR
jgi:hypothetical protein